MKYFIPTLLVAVLNINAVAQADRETAVLKACLTYYKYDAEKDQFFTSSGDEISINKLEIISVNDIETAVIWTSAGDASDAFTKHDIAIGVLKEKNGKYELLSQTTVVADYQMLSEFSTTTYTISTGGTEALSIKYGRDTDGDGDEVLVKLFSVATTGAELILNLTVVDNSGDGCDVSRMEADLTVTEETTSDYFDIQVTEESGTSNSCDENVEESCTKKRTYKYTWNGTEYTSY